MSSYAITNLWNRNALVATPTFVGNCLGLALGLPLGALAGVVVLPIDAVSGGDLVQRAFWIPPFATSLAVGGLVGAPFIPASLVRPSEPDYCWAD